MAKAPFINQAVSKSKAKVFEPVGRCIYCPDGKPPYTREHIMPLGFGGGLILPYSSCGVCQKVTHEIETYCLRGPFLPYRLKSGLVRHLYQLGETLPLRFQKGDQRETRHIPIKDYPNYLALPRIHEAPGIMTGASIGQQPLVSYCFWGDKEELQKLNATGNALLLDNFNLLTFYRVLAKIAHSFIAAEIRIENFDPYLLDIIHGRKPELATYLIGNWSDGWPQKPTLPQLHQIGFALRRRGPMIYVVVRIRLFAEHDKAPEYMIVVGELIQSPGLLKRLEPWLIRPNS